jgi:hypothetical protein
MQVYTGSADHHDVILLSGVLGHRGISTGRGATGRNQVLPLLWPASLLVVREFF